MTHVRPTLSLTLTALIATPALAQSTTAPATPQVAVACAVPQALNGTWHSDDGGVFTLRQVGAQVWWVGKSQDGGQQWTSVFRGTRIGNTVTGNWVDVSGARRSQGTLTVQGNTQYGFADFRRVSGSGTAVSTRWVFACNDVPNAPHP